MPDVPKLLAPDVEVRCPDRTVVTTLVSRRVARPTSLADLPVPERMRAFASSLVRPGVALPPPVPSPAPAAASGPAALAAFEDAMGRCHLDVDALGAFDRPVHLSHGSLSSERWGRHGHAP